GAVTIATNMAGRGTDIVLGGNWEYEVAAMENPSEEEVARIKAEWTERHNQVLENGGLHIIGTERHESRRIDNQLRGRAGRQGDPGSSRFFLSLEDNLMRIFAPERVKNLMQAMGMKKGEAIEHRMVTNAIEKSQRKVEGRNFDMRKTLLEYDDVANDQRTVIYDQRNEVMASEDVSEMVDTIRADVVENLVSEYIPPQSMPEQWDVAGLESQLQSEMAIDLPVQQWLDEDKNLYEESLREKILEAIVSTYRSKEEIAGAESMRKFEKQVFLQVLDTLWKEHLSNMDHLRRGIHLRGYAQKNPKQEYKREAFNLFEDMLDAMKRDVTRILCHVRVQSQEEMEEVERRRKQALEQELSRARMRHDETSATAQSQGEGGSGQGEGQGGQQQATPETFVRQERKVGRNEPCPCGSGKKYKQCHGKVS
ncbi:MAG: preprotein translocase subunit SecA, partial [Gammaproteobacteria bacterium]